MRSSTSSSEAARWKRFFLILAGGAAGLSLLIYAWIVVIDPYDTLHVSPDLPRLPTRTDVRFWSPSLARKAAYDSAAFGTSTSWQMRPAVLDELFDARFVNLSIAAGTAYEQSRILEVFARHHPDAKVVLFGIGRYWTVPGEDYQRYSGVRFPEYMVDDDPWNDYAEQFNLQTFKDSWKQLSILTGMRRGKYHPDGYGYFVAPVASWDPEAVRASMLADLEHAPLPGEAPVVLTDAERAELRFPALVLLKQMLERLPTRTLKIVWFVPWHVAVQPPPGTREAAILEESKRRIVTLAAAVPNAVVLDFLIESPITTEVDHYWDQFHPTPQAADRVMRLLREGAEADEDGASYRVLLPRTR
ncbi:MAG: hypothetical protein ACYTG6_04080 [Planctomycetota bacterium]|jgi:hypothetical protein